MTRRTLLLFCAIVVVGYGLATVWVLRRSAPLEDRGKVTIRVAHWQIEKGPPDGFDAVIRRYEELHPDIRVEQVKVPGAFYRQWLRTNLTGRTATDLIEFAYFLSGVNDVPIRYFEPLTPLMSRPNPYNRGTPMEGVPWRSTFADGLYVMLALSPEIGQVYGVTLSQGSSRLFCNLDLLRKITGGSDQPPATLHDFRRLCVEAAAYSERTHHKIYPLAGSLPNTQWLSDFVMIGAVAGMNLELDEEGYLTRYPWQAEADYLRGRWSYRRPELKAGLALLREFTQQMRPGFAQLSRDNAIQEFVRGDALFIYAGTYDATSLKRLAPFPVGPMRLPQPTRDDPIAGRFYLGRYQDGLLGTGFEIYLNKDTPHRAEALDFLYFLTSVEGGQLFMDHSGWVSAIRGVNVPPAMQVYLSTGDGLTTGAQYTGGGVNGAMAFWQNFNRLANPQGSVDSFVDGLEHNLRPLVVRDLQNEIATFENADRAVDSEIVAVDVLARRPKANVAEFHERRETLAANQSISEARTLEAKWILQHAEEAGARTPIRD